VEAGFSMKAMVIHAPMQFGVEEVADAVPDEGGFLLRVEACGLCGSDLRTLRSGHSNVRFPWTLGHEICGVVEDCGRGYEGPWKRGERLSVGPLVYDPSDPFCIDGRHNLSDNVREIGQAWEGGLAEWVAIPEEAVRLGNILRTPEGLTSAQATVVEPTSSVVHAQERARVGLGDTVLVMGAGPIGCLHVAVARARGARRVIISDLIQERLNLSLNFGPDVVINSRTSDLREEVARATNGKMPEVIITAAPSPDAQVEAVRLAQRGGRVVLFGGLPHDNSTPGVDTNIVHYHNLDIIGTSIFSPRHFRLAMDLIETGRIPVDQLITKVFPLVEFAQGAMMALEGRVLKVVFNP